MQQNESQKLEKRLYSRLNKAMREYGLIDDGDKVLIGLSGGKDSLALVKLLGKRARIAKPRFSVVALHVRMKEISYESSTEYLEEFCRENGVELIMEEAAISPAAKPQGTGQERSVPGDCVVGPKASKKVKTPCFLCSWNRRKALFTKAQELGCNKIALGHHRDDIIHTAMLNLFFQGQFDTMPAKLRMKKMPLTIIRPLCLTDESDLRKYAGQNAFRKQNKSCPHEHESNRTTMADIFRQIEGINPEARFCVMRALETERKLVQ